jgi:hypothetical protein
VTVVAEPFEKPDGEDEVMALAESRGWPTIRGLVGGGDDGLHWRRRIRWFTANQLREARTLLIRNKPPLALEGAGLPISTPTQVEARRR